MLPILEKNPITTPSAGKTLSADKILYGIPISPINRVRVMSDKEYEDFIGEWLWGCVMDNYIQIFHLGGAGDLGRDFAAHVTDNGEVWDNYQCKHYKKPLSPSAIIKEVAKLVFHCFKGRYPWPRKYYFVSPEISSSSYDLLKDTKKIKNRLLSDWDTSSKGISVSESTELSSSIQEFIEKADFSIFGSIPAEEIINQHRQTVYYAPRFGGGLQTRPRDKPKVSVEIQQQEQIYTKKLFDAYSADGGTPIISRNDLKGCPDLIEHFNRQREDYYEAETLKQFSRENLPPGSEVFEELKEDIYHGIMPAIEGEYSSCRGRLNAALLAASQTAVEGNVLRGNIRVQDKKGVCHHLANDKDDIRWTNK